MESKTISRVKNTFSTILLVVMACLFVFVAVSTYQAKEKGETMYLFGYQPIYVKTGSMEPTLMTNGVAITKKVKDIKELKEGDIITYHVYNEDGKKIRITHRIEDIKDDGMVITKGDNNSITDPYPLTMDNIDNKVIVILNWTASVVAFLSTTGGKVMIICGIVAILLFAVAFHLWRKESDGEEKEKP